MNKLFTGLLVSFIVIVAISLILHLIYNKPKENFGGGRGSSSRGSGSASYQNSYNGMDAYNYTEGFKSMKNKKLLHQLNGNDPCIKAQEEQLEILISTILMTDIGIFKIDNQGLMDV